MIDLDGRRMHVARTAEQGVVDAETVLMFRQRGVRVWATYAGGRITRGRLVGRWVGDVLAFRYVQIERDAGVHAGQSIATAALGPTGRIRVFERFEWATRTGRGTNVFEELPD
jgi:hypothetical protein